MYRTTRTIAEETALRARAARLEPTPALEAAVREQLSTWGRVHLEYLDLKNETMIGEVVVFPELDLEWVRLNVGHEWIAQVMCNRRHTSLAQRDALEVVLMVLAGVGREQTDEEREFWTREWSTIGRRLDTAAHVMFDPDKRTGLDMFGEDPRANEEEDLEQFAEGDDEDGEPCPPSRIRDHSGFVREEVGS